MYCCYFNMEKYYEHLAELEKGKPAESPGMKYIIEFNNLEKQVNEELEEE